MNDPLHVYIGDARRLRDAIERIVFRELMAAQTKAYSPGTIYAANEIMALVGQKDDRAWWSRYLAELIVQNSRQAKRIQKHRRIITRLLAERRKVKTLEDAVMRAEVENLRLLGHL